MTTPAEALAIVGSQFSLDIALTSAGKCETGMQADSHSLSGESPSAPLRPPPVASKRDKSTAKLNSQVCAAPSSDQSWQRPSTTPGLGTSVRFCRERAF